MNMIFLKWRTALVLCLLSCIALVSMFPLYEMVATSLKSDADAFRLPPAWFFIPTIENYRQLLQEHHFGRALYNSLVVTLSSTVVSVSAGAAAAYAMQRFRYRGKKAITVALLLLRVIPPVVLVIPIFVWWTALGLVNSLAGLALVYGALNVPFNVWVITTFVAEIPPSLDESAKLDGCSHWMIFTRIVMPLITPALAVVSIFTFRFAWNEYMLGFALTNRKTRTLPVALSLFLTDSGVEWGRITAAATLIAIPACVFTFAAAKYLVVGLTAGAVKG